MRNFLLIGFILFFVNSTLFAGIKKEVDMKQFLSELKTIQEQINKNKISDKNINNDIQNINKQIQYKNIIGNSKNDEIMSKKIKNSISFLNNYLSLLNKKIKREKHIFSDSYYKIKGIEYIKVNKDNVDNISKKVYTQKLEILKIKKLLSLLKSFKSFDKKILLSNQITLVMNDMMQYKNNSQTNYNNTIMVNSRNTKYDFCSSDKKCFGYKVINITSNEIILDF